MVSEQPKMSHIAKKNREAMETFSKLRRKNPEVMSSFMGFVSEVHGDGGLSSKMKHIISIALSLIQQCEWCIAYHTKKAIEQGATEQEIMDATFVATFFGGGPTMMHSRMVMEAIEEFMHKE